MAQRIVNHRESQGPFLNEEDIMQVNGIGEMKYDQIREYVSKSLTSQPTPAAFTPFPMPPYPQPSHSYFPAPVPGSSFPFNRGRSLNQASKEDLMRIPGIGDSLADLILRSRFQNRGFKDWDQIQSIPGIGEQRMKLIQQAFTIP